MLCGKSFRLINNRIRLLYKPYRLFTSTSRPLASSPDNKTTRKLESNAQLNDLKPENVALQAYHYFMHLQNTPNPILTDEYRQIPDDSQFIEKHYHQLVMYRDQICGIGGHYGDLERVSDLFWSLSKLHPTANNIINEAHSSILKLQAEKFNQFVIDLVQALKLNGGHLFALDLLIYNKRVFDHMEESSSTV